MDNEVRLAAVTNVPKIKPRMSTSSVNKSFNSTLKSRARLSTSISPARNDIGSGDGNKYFFANLFYGYS